MGKIINFGIVDYDSRTSDKLLEKGSASIGIMGPQNLLDATSAATLDKGINALLDNGINPIYEMATEDSINTTAEHPYYVKPDLPNKASRASEGAKTLSGSAFFNPLSPENIGQLKARHKAIYGTSLPCGANCLALGKNCRNSPIGIKSISSIKNSYASSNSCSDNLVNFNAFDLCFLTSSSKNSGAISSNLPDMAFSENTEEGTPLFIREDITTFASTTNFSGITYPLLLESSLLYLLANELLTSLASSSACSSVNFDLETIFLNLTTFRSLSFNTLLTSADSSGLGINLNSDSNSLGILTTSSGILTSPLVNNENGYLKLSNKTPLGEWVEVIYLKVGDEIAVPDYSTGTIKWEKIASITILEPQHIYDLSIEGAKNFIANDIVAHNNYLATASGKVGIGTTTPSSTLEINGNLTIEGKTNSTLGNFSIIQFNSSCVGFRFNSSTGGGLFSCA